MELIVTKTELPSVLLFKHNFHEDHRGTYEELYNKETYSKVIKEAIGKDIEFLEDNFATSTKHVLRGIHGDDRTWKLVTCLKGRFYIVVVDCLEGFPAFGKWQSFILSGENKNQLLVPPNYGHAYLVMSDEAIFHYKQSCIYQGMEGQFTYRYDNPRFDIWWPVKDPIVSRRDFLGRVD